MKGMGNMMKEAQRLQREMERMQEEVAKKTVEATSGGGMVTVQANGRQELIAIKGDLPGDMIFHCLVYDPVDNVFIFIGSKGTYAYRLDNQPGQKH